MNKQQPMVQLFDPGEIMDAPEYYQLSRALGILTWGTWDHGVRPFEQRLAEFLASYPAQDPVRFIAGGFARSKDGTFSPITRMEKQRRFLSRDGASGSLPEVLARYGLKLRSTVTSLSSSLCLPTPKEAAQRRNLKLRTLHGRADVEARDMDAAKSDLLERSEKRRAAEEIRSARARLRKDLEDGER